LPSGHALFVFWTPELRFGLVKRHGQMLGFHSAELNPQKEWELLKSILAAAQLRRGMAATSFQPPEISFGQVSPWGCGDFSKIPQIRHLSHEFMLLPPLPPRFASPRGSIEPSSIMRFLCLHGSGTSAQVCTSPEFRVVLCWMNCLVMDKAL
jgi:hypothetical protein